VPHHFNKVVGFFKIMPVSLLERVADKKVLIKATSRHGFTAPPGYCVVSLDFYGQEIVIAAYLSQDKIMLRALSEDKEKLLLGPDGQPIIKDGKQVYYPNPWADLHTITCRDCCFPNAFLNQPESEWVRIAKTTAPGLLKDMRFYAKITNFQILYGATAQALSEANYVKVEVAQEWLNRHMKTFFGYHQWKNEQGHLATARGWSTDIWGRQRYVNEDNSKASGASPARSGVNFKVQGTGATMMKVALWKLHNALKYIDGYLCVQVHDEALLVLKGNMVLDEERMILEDDKKVLKGEKSLLKDRIISPVYKPDAQLAENIKICKQCMIDAMSEVLNGFPGGASADAAPYWAH
jgi:hypothetical protein